MESGFKKEINKPMKILLKLIVGTAALTLILTFTGCGSDTKETADNNGQAGQAGDTGAATATAGTDPVKSQEVTADKVRDAAERCARFLLAKQNDDGSFGEFGPSVGMTGLAVLGLAVSPESGSDEVKKAIDRAVAFMMQHTQPDGGIYIKTQPYNSYETSISILALARVDKARYQKTIDTCVKYIKGIQDDGSKDPKNKGGIGYGSKGVASNLSTTQYALQALKAAGLKEDDEAWKRAVAFVSTLQNQSETNPDNEWAAVVNDGGFIYNPQGSKAGEVKVRGKVGWRSYGSMTYAGYLSLVYANVAKDDPRVKGAEKWISANYTLKENPGMKFQGLYYYYNTFALAFTARGEKTIKLADGTVREWARDLGARLLSLQDEDGGFTNAADRWKEGSRVICASYSLRALSSVLAQLEK
jgi:squalene-hopene/tetraprenyl-beta-curcumene cyclase